jgi:hypothetical protein
MYADFIRKIYLVTDDQIPEWLNPHHPKINIVSHKNIFPETTHLPTFNSHAIESRLHHLEGLSEHYIYMNDDVFFSNVVIPKLFFTSNGSSIAYLSKATIDLGPPSREEPTVTSAAKNNRMLIEQKFGVTVTNKFRHVPHSQQRSLLFEMESVYKEHFVRTAKNRFRATTDIAIPTSLIHYYAYLMKRGVLVYPESIAKKDQALPYSFINLGDPIFPAALKHQWFYKRNKVFCLNDPDELNENSKNIDNNVNELLSYLFPIKSEFEK